MATNNTELGKAIEEIEGWGDSEPITSNDETDEFVEIEVPSEQELAEMGKAYIKRELKVGKQQIGKYRRLLKRQLRNVQYPTAISDMHNSEEYLIHLSAALAIFLGENVLDVLKNKKEQLETLSLKYTELGKKMKKRLAHKDPTIILSSLKVGNMVRAAELYFGCANYSKDNVNVVANQISSFGRVDYPGDSVDSTEDQAVDFGWAEKLVEQQKLSLGGKTYTK